ncbi:MAG: transglycosylase SLT domain-containing protein, partial [Ignavibacteria bacterium]|nr:transglycosylase SLT domain-containing protein [Ignavibacteria bacterium]
MIKTKLLLFSFLLVFSQALHSQSEIEEMMGDTLQLMEGDTSFQASAEFLEQQSDQFSTEDSPVVKMLDSLYKITYFSETRSFFDSTTLNKYGYASYEIPTFSDSVYAARIADLNRETPIPLVYNVHVKGFIELYAMRKRGLTSRMLGLSYVYFPMFEELLDRYNIPLEMKYLAMVESALNPVAGSPMGAKGLWQFMYGTG